MDNQETRECLGCHQALPLSSFCKNKRKKDGVNIYCRSCCSREGERYRQTEGGKEAGRQKTRRYYRKHRRQILDTLYQEYHTEPDRREARLKVQQRWEASGKGNVWRKTWRKAHPEQVPAHSAVKHAVIKGTLIRVDQCSSCGKPGKTVAHHHLGYAKEHHLDVIWLCRSCHYWHDRKKA